MTSLYKKAWPLVRVPSLYRLSYRSKNILPKTKSAREWSHDLASGILDCYCPESNNLWRHSAIYPMKSTILLALTSDKMISSILDRWKAATSMLGWTWGGKLSCWIWRRIGGTSLFVECREYIIQIFGRISRKQGLVCQEQDQKSVHNLYFPNIKFCWTYIPPKVPVPLLILL